MYTRRDSGAMSTNPMAVTTTRDQRGRNQDAAPVTSRYIAGQR